jgi:hypothetical protein
MTSDITPEFKTHLEGRVTNLATLIDVVRLDGRTFFLTSFNRDIEYGGQTYRARSGFDRSSMARNASLAVDDTEIEGMTPQFMLDHDDITQRDLAAGLFDGARVRIQTAVWSDPTIPPKRDVTYFMGPVTTADNGTFRVQILSLAEALQQGIIKSYTVKCQHDLGDSGCRVPILPPVIERSENYAIGDTVRIRLDYDIETTLPNGQPTQDVYKNLIFICTQAGTTAAADRVTVSGEFDFDSAYQTISRTEGSFLDDEIIPGMLVEFEDNATNTGPFTIESVSAMALEVAEIPVDQFGFEGEGFFYIPYDETIGQESTDGTAVFQALDAWTRHGEVVGVVDDARFVISLSDARAADDDWFPYGVMTFETGENAGFSAEVKEWNGGTGQIELFPQFPPFETEVGDKIRIYPGCNKLDTTCANKFDNILNHLGFSFIPGQRVLSDTEAG